MSPAAARRLHREERHVCLKCRNHPARFRYEGEVRADRDHTLCFRCFRAEVNRARARGISEAEYMAGNLLGREVLAEDVAQAFVGLAKANKTTGHVEAVDGGNIAAALR